jgi:dienelactone hydrolase
MTTKYDCMAELPDPFLFDDGSRVRDREDWRLRRAEIAETVLDVEYGGIPPEPASLDIERLHTHGEDRFQNAEFTQYRIVHGECPAFHFRLDLLVPGSDAPSPVVLTGDGCWRNVTDELTGEVLRRGFALAVFTRTAIVPDIPGSGRDTGLYRVYPDHTFGALSAWAWSYHRCVDALEEIGGVDASRVAITGHSRGGKTVLLAGATDERIALTAPNASGLGGAGSFLFQGPECERLADILERFPYWFGPALGQYLNREEELPFDQHFLKALIAPRAYVNTNALGDLWANPSGTWQTHRAAHEVYRFLDAEDRIGIHYRPGGHSHGVEDWQVFLDFAQRQLQDEDTGQSLHDDPYPELEPAFSWRAPGSVADSQ